MDQHWSYDSVPEPESLRPEVQKLITDPEAPYGRHSDGHALTLSEYEDRYNKFGPEGQHYNHYPPNDGAVRGSIVEYDAIDAFLRDYGPMLDRLGDNEGKYMALMQDGIPASFESRGLPIDSLLEPYNSFSLSGSMPEGWRIQISEVAPAFGRDGGSLQVRVKNQKGQTMNIDELYEAEILQ